MQRFITIMALTAAMALAATAATTTGSITADETWDGTVTVSGDMFIDDGATLTINPGTVVKFTTSNDNVVIGGSGTIYLTLLNGSIVAEGTADNRITFTTANTLAPSPGSWGRIQIAGTGNTASFKYCDIEYCQNGILLNNDKTGLTGASTVTVDYCHIYKNSSTAVYANKNHTVTVTNSYVQDCMKAFFSDQGNMTVSNTFINTTSTGFIFAGGADNTAPTAVIDHVTMYNVDMMMAGTSPQWWAGYGIFCTNTAYSATFTNSIFYQSTLANLKANGWTVTENNNCFHTGMMGLANYEDGTVNTAGGSVEADPMFTDGANGDFSLDALSPCIDAASDGTNMGAWQDDTVWPVFGTGAVTTPAAGTLPEGVTLSAPAFSGIVCTFTDAADARLDVYDASGALAGSVSGTRTTLALDGSALTAGVHYAVVTVDGRSYTKAVTVIK